MARTPTKYYVVDIGTDGKLEYDDFTDKEALTKYLATLDPAKATPLVFASPPISFSISRDPVVTIGAVEKKPRAKKQKAKAANGSVATTPVSTTPVSTAVKNVNA